MAPHLMESPGLDRRAARFMAQGDREVGKMRYAGDGRVYINNTQYFEGGEKVAWDFYIGGYQVLHKWLRDRKGRKSSYDELAHYQKIVVALEDRIRLTGEIDAVLP